MRLLAYTTRIRPEVAIFLKGGRISFGSQFAGVSRWQELEEAASHMWAARKQREKSAGAQTASLLSPTSPGHQP